MQILFSFDSLSIVTQEQGHAGATLGKAHAALCGEAPLRDGTVKYSVSDAVHAPVCNAVAVYNHCVQATRRLRCHCDHSMHVPFAA